MGQCYTIDTVVTVMFNRKKNNQARVFFILMSLFLAILKVILMRNPALYIRLADEVVVM